jgi:tRNA nucleotidyltransferase (CCA-adding enzyme)
MLMLQPTEAELTKVQAIVDAAHEAAQQAAQGKTWNLSDTQHGGSFAKQTSLRDS